MFFFSGSKGRSLLGFIHQPESMLRQAGIVFCHPFAEEKNMSHSVVVKTARALAQQGIAVLRFDMSGCGDSEGELDEVTLADWIDDLNKAVVLFKSQLGLKQHALWGLRFGAGLAVLHASQYEDAAGLILWQPSLDLKTYAHQFLRSKISTEIMAGGGEALSVSAMVSQLDANGMVNVMGYPISKKLYAGFSEVSAAPLHWLPFCPTLVLSMSMTARPPVSLERYCDRVRSKGAPIEHVHLEVEPFWDRYWRWECQEVERVTLKWVESILIEGY